jgi:SNF2 family DNA or RNA helicase
MVLPTEEVCAFELKMSYFLSYPLFLSSVCPSSSLKEIVSNFQQFLKEIILNLSYWTFRNKLATFRLFSHPSSYSLPLHSSLYVPLETILQINRKVINCYSRLTTYLQAHNFKTNINCTCDAFCLCYIIAT